MIPKTITYQNRSFVVCEVVRELPNFGWQLFTRDAENDLPRLFVLKSNGEIIA